MLLQPIATSTPVRAVEYHPPPPQEIAGNANPVSTNRLIELMNSNINNEAHVDTRPNEPINILPAGATSNDVQNIAAQGENSAKENSERLNRSNFFFKDVVTSMTYMDIFISIIKQYPLIQMNTTQNSPKIQYLCTAGNVLFMYIVSLDLYSRYINIIKQKTRFDTTFF